MNASPYYHNGLGGMANLLISAKPTWKWVNNSRSEIVRNSMVKGLIWFMVMLVRLDGKMVIDATPGVYTRFSDLGVPRHKNIWSIQTRIGNGGCSYG